MRWLDGIINSMDTSLSKLQEIEGQGSLMYYSLWGCKESDMTEQLTHNIYITYIYIIFNVIYYNIINFNFKSIDITHFVFNLLVLNYLAYLKVSFTYSQIIILLIYAWIR